MWDPYPGNRVGVFSCAATCARVWSMSVVRHSPWGQDPSGLCMCVDCDVSDIDVPEGTWDSKPGDMFALDADVTLYWPVVRECWEEK